MWAITAESLIAGYMLVSIPGDPKNAWLFGFSTTRVVMILAVLAVLAGSWWAGAHLWRGSKWGQRLRTAIDGAAGNEKTLGMGMHALSAGIIVGIYLLAQLMYISDAHYRGILERLAAVIFLGTAISVSAAWYRLRGVKEEESKRWLQIFLFVGGMALLERAWLPKPRIEFPQSAISWLIGGTILLAQIYAALVQRRAGDKQGAWLAGVFALSLLVKGQAVWLGWTRFDEEPLLYTPVLVLGAALIWNAGAGLRNGTLRKAAGYGALTAALVCLGAFYFTQASAHAKNVNVNIALSDQNGFVNFTRQVKETGFRFSGHRNQMPLYPYIQAVFMDSDASEAQQFERGKQVNIILSLALLAGIFVLGRSQFGLHHSINLTLICAFGLYIFKAGYYQVEALYYFLAFGGFWLMAKMVAVPSLKLGIATGAVLAITHYAKASVLPGLLIFWGVYGIKEILTREPKPKAVMEGGKRQSPKKRVASVLLVGVVYLGLLSPYLHESKQIYGKYFYNLNSTFFIWYDSWNEALVGVTARGAQVGWPDMPDDEIPSAQKYWREHSLEDIGERLWSGSKHQFENISNPYGFYNYPLMFLAAGALLFGFGLPKSLNVLRKHGYTAGFSVSYFIAHIPLFGWLSPVANFQDYRFVYGLYLPFMFAISMAIKTLAAELETIKVFKYTIKTADLAAIGSMVVTVMILTDAAIVIPEQMMHPDRWFGK